MSGRPPPPVLLGQQVILIGLDEQLNEQRVHDVPPRADGCKALLRSPGAGAPVRAVASILRGRAGRMLSGGARCGARR